MEVLIKITYLFIVLTVGTYLYYWSSNFKKLGASTMKELNEEEENKEDLFNESETKMLNYFGTTMFIIIGVLIWTILGITVGKIAADITDKNFLKWLVYFLMYFIFLRFPFGVGNKMVKRSYSFNRLPEKFIFFIVIIASYILSICSYDKLPQLLKWHLYYLN